MLSNKCIDHLKRVYGQMPQNPDKVDGHFVSPFGPPLTQLDGTLDVNTSRLRQNGRHFADDVFKCIFLNENVWFSLDISLKFVPKVLINNIPTLVQIMTRRLNGANPLSEAMLVYWRIYASHGFSELTRCLMQYIVVEAHCLVHM